MASAATTPTQRMVGGQLRALIFRSRAQEVSVSPDGTVKGYRSPQGLMFTAQALSDGTFLVTFGSCSC